MKKKFSTFGTAVLHHITPIGYNSFTFPSKIINHGSDEYILIVVCEYDGKEHFLVLPVHYDDGEKDLTNYSDSPPMAFNEALKNALTEHTSFILDCKKALYAGSFTSTERSCHVHVLKLENVYEEPVWEKGNSNPKKYGAAVWLPIQDYTHLLTTITQQALKLY